MWLSLAILVVAVIAGALSFRSAYHESHELQDDDLRQVAAMFDQQHLPVAAGGIASAAKDVDVADRILIQVLSRADGSPVPAAVPALPPGLPDGLQTIEVHHITYRVFVKTLGSDDRIAVAQDVAARDEIAQLVARHALEPFVYFVPVLIGMITLLVRRNFRRVKLIAREVDQRDERALHHIELHELPTEILPFIVAINRLLDRIALSMAEQRQFVADAAHELRSPLTALSLQAEQLAKAEMSDKAQERLQVLRQGIDRGRSLLDQLLTLARAQAATNAAPTPASTQQAVRAALELLLPLAEHKGIDVGVSTEVDAWVAVGAFDLLTMVKNLLDNAIRYTQQGGAIDIAIEDGASLVRIVVEDNGPGIPAAERERVFDPFYRVLGSEEIGSGLGLSIVGTIAAHCGARVELADATQSSTGLRASLVLPKAMAPAAPVIRPSDSTLESEMQ
ncbi:MAG: two-component sensor histidine kinase [Burkholderiales bacterium]|nr:two-component sensor histidine kinase [Burkholderiales bacterium]